MAENKENDILSETVKKLGFAVFRGSEEDVLDRYYQAAKCYSAEVVVRITGDCPLIDPNIVDDVIELYKKRKADYASNIDPPTYPDGLDTEVFSFRALEIAHRNATTTYDREHVTAYFYKKNSKFKIANFSFHSDLSKLRWTLDTKKDLIIIKKIIKKIKRRPIFLKDILMILKKEPELMNINQDIPIKHDFFKFAKILRKVS